MLILISLELIINNFFEDLDFFDEDGSDEQKRAPWRQELLNSIALSET